jgi:hypothetical protein
MVFFVINATTWSGSASFLKSQPSCPGGAENICSSIVSRMAPDVIIHENCGFLDQKIEDHSAEESHRDKLFLRD